MIEGNSYVKKSKKELEKDLRKEFILSSKDETFKKLCNRLKCEEDLLMKYTSKLEVTSCELKNCSKCKSIDKCQNEIEGHVYYPIVKDGFIEFIYKPCKHFKENVKKNTTTFFETPKSLQNASLAEVIVEKERNTILKYIKEFLKKKKNNEPAKGLYLSGSFGSGKSYLLSALLNELSNQGYKTVNVYYPSLLKRLKSAFGEFNYDEVLDEIMTSDALLIDDIGAENNSAWARDEVLGTILQYRMDNDLTTFFTSNFTIEELETVLSETSKGNDIIKSRRIIERIKCLTNELSLVSVNKRK
ncbi:MAG: primosomal protein DnaI [Bacilli bacterium]|nr:primosomal protein DnaI [Bacilli bacterium]